MRHLKEGGSVDVLLQIELLVELFVSFLLCIEEHFPDFVVTPINRILQKFAQQTLGFL